MPAWITSALHAFVVWLNTPAGEITGWAGGPLAIAGAVYTVYRQIRRLARRRGSRRARSTVGWSISKPSSLRPSNFSILNFSPGPSIDLRDGWTDLTALASANRVLLLVARSGNGKSRTLHDSLRLLPGGWGVVLIPLGADATRAPEALRDMAKPAGVSRLMFVIDDLDIHLSSSPDLDALWEAVLRYCRALDLPAHLLMTLREETDQVARDPSAPVVVHQARVFTLRLLSAAEGRRLSPTSFGQHRFDGTPASLLGVNATRLALLRKKPDSARRLYYLLRCFDAAGVPRPPARAVEVAYARVWAESLPTAPALRALRTYVEIDGEGEGVILSGRPWELREFTSGLELEYGVVPGRDIADALIQAEICQDVALLIAERAALDRDRPTSLHIWKQLLPAVPARYSPAYTYLAISLMEDDAGLADAKMILDAGRSQHPRDMALAAKYGELLRRVGEPTRALAVMREVVDSHPKDKLALAWYLGTEMEVSGADRVSGPDGDRRPLQMLLPSLVTRARQLDGAHDALVVAALAAMAEAAWAESESIVISYLETSRATGWERTKPLAGALLRLLIALSPEYESGSEACRYMREDVSPPFVVPSLELASKISRQPGRGPAITAMRLYEACVGDLEKPAGTFTAMNRLCSRLGDWTGAVRWGRMAVESSPGQFNNLLALAEALYGLAKYTTPDRMRREELIAESDSVLDRSAVAAERAATGATPGRSAKLRNRFRVSLERDAAKDRLSREGVLAALAHLSATRAPT